MKHTATALLIAIGLALQAANAQAPAKSRQADLIGAALVIVDPQVDFLSSKGATWKIVGKSVEANHTVENLEALLRAAKGNGIIVFVSPHYYYPWDHEWDPAGGAGQEMMRKLKPFERRGPLTVQGFENSGADWMPQYKQFINDGSTVIASPHKLYGPEVNDLVLQLRKRHVTKTILAGMSANLCIESHMRHLLEQGFEVDVVKDATAAFQLPGLDGYAAALTNFQMIANAVTTTEEVVRAFNGYESSK